MSYKRNQVEEAIARKSFPNIILITEARPAHLPFRDSRKPRLSQRSCSPERRRKRDMPDLRAVVLSRLRIHYR
jgi:hypothetical protein